MDDLIKRLQEMARYGNALRRDWTREMDEAATALTEAAATIAQMEAKVVELQAGLQEALDWNWLDDDAPEHVRERLWLLSQPAPGKGE